MRRLFALLASAVAVTSVSFARVQDEPYGSEADAKAALERAQAQIHTGDGCVAGVTQRNDDNNRQWRKANDDINRIVNERNRAVAELRAGLYCSKCGKTKSEFEKVGQDFYKHIEDVKAQAISAPPEKIQQKIDEYRQKIAGVEKTIQEYQQNFQQNQKDVQGCQALRNEGLAESSRAQYWSTVLRYRAEQAERQRQIEEAARRMRERIEAENERRRQAYEAYVEEQRQKMEQKKEALASLQEKLSNFQAGLASMFGRRSDPDYIIPDSEDSASINRGYFGNDSDPSPGGSEGGVGDVAHYGDALMRLWNSGAGALTKAKLAYRFAEADDPVEGGFDVATALAKKNLSDRMWDMLGNSLTRRFAGDDYNNPEIRESLERLGFNKLPKRFGSEITNMGFWSRMRQSGNRIVPFLNFTSSYESELYEGLRQFDDLP